MSKNNKMKSIHRIDGENNPFTCESQLRLNLNAVTNASNKKKRANRKKKMMQSNLAMASEFHVMENSAFDDRVANETVTENIKPIEQKGLPTTSHFSFKHGDNKNRIRKNKCAVKKKVNSNTELLSVSKVNTRTINRSAEIPKFLLVDFDKKPEIPSQNISYKNSIMELFPTKASISDTVFNTINKKLDVLSVLEGSDSEDDVESVQSISSSEEDTDCEDASDDAISENREKTPEVEIAAISEQRPEDTFKIYHTTQFSILLMKSSSKVYFCGKLKASLIYGRAEVFGHELNYNPWEIYSVVTSNLLCFEASPHNDIPEHIQNTFGDIQVPPNIIKEILMDFTKADTLLLLKPHSNKMTQFMNKHITSYDIFTNINSVDKKQICSPLIKCTFYSGEYSNTFVKDPIWNQVVTKIESSLCTNARSVTLICGGKGVGKSTTLRYLVNKILKHRAVLVLDLDPGQSEFTICGSVSATIVEAPIIGPNFTHLLKPEKSFAIGLINVAENHERYINAVSDLCKFLNQNEKYKTVPWIINTMGFTKSLGFKLMLKVLNIFKPTSVLEIRDDKKANKNFDFPLTTANVNRENRKFSQFFPRETGSIVHDYEYYASLAHTVRNKSLPRLLTVRRNEAVVERALNALAYFSEMVSPTSLSLLDVEPRMISCSDITIAMNENISDFKYVYNILNGRLITLCYDPSQMNVSSNVIKLNKRPMESYGFGLIRGVDPTKGTLYILTPLGNAVLNRVNVLMYAESLPDCSAMLSVPHLKEDVMIPYATSVKKSTEHSYLHQIPKRKYCLHKVQYKQNK